MTELIDVENLIPYTDRIDLGAPAYFDASKLHYNADAEFALASAIAILLSRNAGGADNIQRDGNSIRFEDTNGLKYRVVCLSVS